MKKLHVLLTILPCCSLLLAHEFLSASNADQKETNSSAVEENQEIEANLEEERSLQALKLAAQQDLAPLKNLSIEIQEEIAALKEATETMRNSTASIHTQSLASQREILYISKLLEDAQKKIKETKELSSLLQNEFLPAQRSASAMQQELLLTKNNLEQTQIELSELKTLASTTREEIAQAQAANANLTSEALTKAAPCACWPWDREGWMMQAEFLWWKIDQSLLDYAYSKDFPVYQSLPTALPSDGLAGNQHKAKFDWEPGFRIAAGYQFLSTPWTLAGEYTWFHSSKIDGAEQPTGNDLQSFTGGAIPIQVLTPSFTGILWAPPLEAVSHIDFHYNIANVTLARHLLFGSKFAFTPFLGAEGAWIDQDWELSFKTTGATATPPFLSSSYISQNKWNFQGGGLLLGAAVDWCGWRGFSLYGAASAAALYGSYETHHVIKTTPAYVEIYERIHEEEHRTIQTTQLKAGIAWSKKFDNQALRIFAGWEFNSWYNLAEVYRFSAADSLQTLGGGNTIPTYSKPRAVDKSDIHLQGFTGGVSLLF